MTRSLLAPLPWQPGDVIGTSSWLTLDQRRITAFGEITNDLEPLHTDPDWCREHSPVGRPMSYGFLTLSLLTSFLHEVTGHALAGSTTSGSYPLNYGFDRIRFVSPVPVNSRVRGQFTFVERRPRSDGELLRFDVVVEIDGGERPALTAEWWSLWVPGSPPVPPPAA
jgi:acyl dehydratase